jgi:hypothetical protein
MVFRNTWGSSQVSRGSSQRAGNRNRQARVSRKQVVVVVGESENDTKSIKELFLALRPDFQGTVIPLREPPILIKDARPEDLPDRATAIAAVIRAEQVAADVVCAIAHEDCDAVEPEHIELSRKIEQSLRSQGIKVHAAAPAWEFETWLFLWPDASVAYRPTWNRPDKYSGKNVGMLQDAKEKFANALIPPGRRRTSVRAYRETDAPAIAAKVRELNMVNSTDATSNSYILFRRGIVECGLDHDKQTE